MMTSTAKLIRLQSDLKEQVRGEYEFRNTQNGTRIITNEMADYSAMKLYLKKISSILPTKRVSRCLPPDTPAEDISRSLEDLGFNVINVRQMTATRRAPNEQIHVEPLHSLLSRQKI
jgi:hypothetical protein